MDGHEYVHARMDGRVCRCVDPGVDVCVEEVYVCIYRRGICFQEYWEIVVEVLTIMTHL